MYPTPSPVAQNDGKSAISEVVPVVATDPAGGDSTDHPLTNAHVHRNPQSATMSTLPLAHIIVSCRAACMHCCNGFNEGFRIVVGVLGDNHAIVYTIIDDGVKYLPTERSRMHYIWLG